MKGILSQWIQMTLVAIVVYIVITNAKGSAGVITASAQGYATAVSPFLRSPSGNAVAGNVARKKR